MRIYPFRALRYNTARVSLEDVVTQPYDKISPAMQQSYYDRSPYNLVRVILGKRQADDDEQHNVYTRAAETLHSWRQQQVLLEESAPAVYGYLQRYTVPGTDEVRERRGLICLGHLYDYSEGVVYRHEQTLSKPKSDRLSLFKATRTYCEQIYMLYADPAFTVEKLVFGAVNETSSPPDQVVTDEYGVEHQLWKVSDPHVLNLIAGAMQNRKLIIADGHHRYETSTTYARERAAELSVPDPTLNTHENHAATRGADKPDRVVADALGDSEASPSVMSDRATPQLPQPPFPEAAMMMTLVNMEAPGITILPTHRVVFGVSGFSAAQFLKNAEPFFDIAPLQAAGSAQTVDAEGVESAHELLAPLNQTEGVAFVAATAEGNYLLRARADQVEAALSHLSPRQRQLDVVQLHALVLERILGLSQESIREQRNLRYLRSASEAVAQVGRGEADVAFLIKPVSLQQMRDVSLSGEVMPQKSTDFYPKLLSGLAMYALDPA